MDVLELVEVETGLAYLVLAQFLQQGGLLLQFAVQIEHQVLFAGREADREPVSLARLAAVVETAKANDCLPPHNSRLPGKLLHQLQHGQAIGTPLLIGDAGKKLVDTGVILLCFQSHAQISPQNPTGGSNINFRHRRRRGFTRRLMGVSFDIT